MLMIKPINVYKTLLIYPVNVDTLNEILIINNSQCSVVFTCSALLKKYCESRVHSAP